MLYSAFDKIDLEFNRNDEKNEWLKKNRDVSFEEVVSVVISEDDLVKIISNPNQKKYPGQKIYVIKIR